MSEDLSFPSFDDFVSQTQSGDLRSEVAPIVPSEMTFPTIQTDSLDIDKRKNLGSVCAELYIASQELCIETSNKAFEIAESKIDDAWFRFGFNQRMSQSKFNVRLDLRDRNY